jgi:cell division FtsZ-interacting protein ZapD
MNTEQMLNKWQSLNADEQEKVLAFIDSLESQKQQLKSDSKLGKKLRQIRQEIIDSGLPLLTAEEADREKAERRGGF